MNPYEITITLPDEVEKAFSTRLRNKKEIVNLIYSSDGKKLEFEELAFTAKYLIGLIRASAKPENSSSDIIRKELAESLDKVKSIIMEIMGESYTPYENKYFGNDASAPQNLTSLLADLELIKLFLNDMKRKS